MIKTAEKSVAHNLLQAFCSLIDSSYFGSKLERKKVFKYNCKNDYIRYSNWLFCTSLIIVLHYMHYAYI